MPDLSLSQNENLKAVQGKERVKDQCLPDLLLSQGINLTFACRYFKLCYYLKTVNIKCDNNNDRFWFCEGLLFLAWPEKRNNFPSV